MPDNRSAFPVAAPLADRGMTLRDYFAAQIAAGDAAVGDDGWPGNPNDETVLNRARLYYRVADAMMTARSE